MANGEPAAARLSCRPDKADDGAYGWQLGHDSWMFHRWYFHVYGQSTERGLYSFLLRQLRWKRGPEVIVAGVYRLKMPDGSTILVTGKRGTTARLHAVLPPCWNIGDPVPWLRNPPHKTAKPEPAPERVKAAAPVLVAQPVSAATPPAKPPRKPFSLDGKNSEMAATLLEYRKRRWG
jgi:hypothetical protein